MNTTDFLKCIYIDRGNKWLAVMYQDSTNKAHSTEMHKKCARYTRSHCLHCDLPRFPPCHSRLDGNHSKRGHITSLPKCIIKLRSPAINILMSTMKGHMSENSPREHDSVDGESLCVITESRHY